MSKYTFLGFVNILFCGFVGFIFIKSVHPESFISILKSHPLSLAPTAILLLCALTNAFFTHLLLFKKKPTLPFYILANLTFFPLIWLGMIFIGFFFASEYIFPIVSFAIAIFSFFYLKKFSKKAAIIISIITLLIPIVTIASSFEEDYCQKKGTEAVKTGGMTVVATKEDSEQLEGFDVKEGSQIGVSFRTHMICHNTFNFFEALKERYSFTK